MKVRIPKRFPAGDKVYRIRCTKRHDDEMDMAELDGLARHGARMEVLIRSGLDPQALQETLVHEVLHCEDTQYNPSGKRLSE
ncbi:MAG: hypothetical protein M0R06_18580, partial [Sphaerochaeta sp.]|nr:hypothetical protein [Sphaerochaeta sp.]